MPSERLQALELRRERAGLVAQAREILDAADRETRELTQDEQTRYEQLMQRVTTMAGDIERREHLERLELETASTLERNTQEQPGDGRNTGLIFESRGLAGRTLEANPAWRALLATARPEYLSAWRSWLTNGSGEIRALQVDSDTAGGFLLAPITFVDRLIRAVDNAVYIRQWANVMAVPTSEGLGAPSLENDPADPTWTAELAIGSEDATMSFGRRELHPHPLAKYIKVSNTMLRKVPSAEALVIQRLGYKFGVTAENAYLNGSGAGQPLGVFTASNDGIGTTRDVSTGNTDTSIQFDGLIEAKYKLAQQYWSNARWLFHADAVKQIAKLKDGNGQYIWRESVRVGEPDRILNLPVFMSAYVPNTFTTAQYVGILGDWSYYWIADALDMTMQRLVELYAATNQTGFIGRLETDGMPVLAEAFARVKLA